MARRPRDISVTPAAGDIDLFGLTFGSKDMSAMVRFLVSKTRTATLLGVLMLAATAVVFPMSSSASNARPHHLTRPVRTFVVRGIPYPSAHRYRLALWRKDDVSNCRVHSYGAPVRRYFRRDPCRAETRYLYTTNVRGRAAVLEVESLETGRLRNDPNGGRSSGELVKLENASGTGGVNDLLREGWSIPHARHIPRHEVFSTAHEDSGVAVFDAWYEHGRTADHDHALSTMESQLYLTSATNFDE